MTHELSFSYFVGERTLKAPRCIVLQVPLGILLFLPVFLDEETYHGPSRTLENKWSCEVTQAEWLILGLAVNFPASFMSTLLNKWSF